MKIGIIGTGHIGGALARRLPALGHQVAIANSRRLAQLRSRFATQFAAEISSS
jgi:predicted dinucleotide-binding enzyme